MMNKALKKNEIFGKQPATERMIVREIIYD